MAGLSRTTLTTSQKVQFAASALARQEEHGAISALSREFEVSRLTVYKAGELAQDVLAQHFEQCASGDAPVEVNVDEAQLQRAVVALRVMAPNSIRAIEDMLPILYPGVNPSFGKIQSICSQAESNAAAFNAGEDLRKIRAGALDEMFSQGDPVLGGVDLDGGYLFGLSLRQSRSGADWAEVLETAKARGLELATVVKDAALGIDAGVREVFPDAERRDDCFHALYEMNKVRRQLEQRAYGAITREQEAEKKLQRIRAHDKSGRREQKRILAQVRRECREAIERYEVFEAAMNQAHEAMEYVELETGALRTGEQAQAMLEAAADAMQGIDNTNSKEVGGYIRNRAPGLSMASAELNDRLQALFTLYTPRAVCLACLVWRLLGIVQKRRRPWQHKEQTRQLLGAFTLLTHEMGLRTDELLDAVKKLLEQRHRASSAIEGFNAALRPFLYIHKGVTQNFLELFRAHYNLRTRRWGRHQGTSAYQCLTGTAVTDWLTLLGYPPSSTVH